MNKFVSIRIRKLHDWGMGSFQNGKKKHGVQGLTAHDLRLIDTPNADPERLREITICSEETGWNPAKLSAELAQKIGANKTDFVAKKAKARIKDLGIDDSRPELCKVVNLMLMVSPQWLRDGSETQPLNMEKSEKWTRIANGFLRERFGDNYLGGLGHMDELNPHLTGYVLPAVFKMRSKAGRKSSKKSVRPAQENWGLDSKSMFTPDKRIRDPDDPHGEREIRIPLTGTLSRLQSEFADYCQKQGLDVVRGIIGSRAKYREVANQNHLLRTQARTREELEKIADVETLREIAVSGIMKAQDYDRVAKELDQIKNQMAKDQKPLLLANFRLSEEKAVIVNEKQRLSKDLSAMSRVVPVGELIEKLTGIDAKPATEPGKYQYVLHSGMTLEVDENTNKFRNLTPAIKGLGNMRDKSGGRGGIDAAIYLTGCTRDAATLLITDLFSIQTATATIAQSIEAEPQTDERKALAKFADTIRWEISQSNEARWPELRKRLVDPLNCNAKIIDELKQRGWIHANNRGHLVTNLHYFPGELASEPAGRIVQDIQDSEAGFYFEYGHNGQIYIEGSKKADTIVVDDLVEALALNVHEAQAAIRRSIIVVGRKPKPRITSMLASMAKSTKLFVSAARTEIGDKFRQWMRIAIPSINEIAPPKDFLSWDRYIRESPKFRKSKQSPTNDIV
ncbi:MAG: plasmid recombination protein [Terrimicrobiaceae bacterium]|nr:plasmid recombination protein [Terrimicrobiaceae bacterium]